MPTSCSHVFVHFVWATWDRRPIITDRLRGRIHAAVTANCSQIRCPVLAIDGTDDHVHVLLRVHPMVATGGAVKEMKGSSSHLVTHAVDPDSGFKWQGCYGAFSVRPEDVPRVAEYIRNQQQHHAAASIIPDWERCEEFRDE